MSMSENELNDLMGTRLDFDQYDSGFHEYIPGDYGGNDVLRDPEQRQIDINTIHNWRTEHEDNHARTDQVPTSSDWEEPLARTSWLSPADKYLKALARPLPESDPNILTDEEFFEMLADLNTGPYRNRPHATPDKPKLLVLFHFGNE